MTHTEITEAIRGKCAQYDSAFARPVDHMARMNAVADATGLIATAKLDCYREHQYGAWDCLCRVTAYLNEQHAKAFAANFRESGEVSK